MADDEYGHRFVYLPSGLDLGLKYVEFVTTILVVAFAFAVVLEFMAPQNAAKNL